jgi:predicted ATP-dependent protease
MVTKKPLAAHLLRKSCDIKQLSFKSTDDLLPQHGFLGHERAIHALTLGITIDSDGFHIYAMGPSGVGKRSVIKSLLGKVAQKKGALSDICYIHNFKDPRKPSLLLLNPGSGKKLEQDMRQLIDILKVSIPAIFEQKEFNLRIKEIQEDARLKQEEAMLRLEEEAKSENITIMETPNGFVLALSKDGKVISEEEFKALPEEEKAKTEEKMKRLREHLSEYLEQIPNLNKALNKQIKEVFKHFAMLEVGALIDDVAKKYQEPQVASFLDQVKSAILNNPNQFRKASGKEEHEAETLRHLNRYLINVLVSQEPENVPVIYEDNPNLANLVGKIEHISQFGALITDFTLIRAGALHKASGGYLLLDAYKLLREPLAWDALKRALRSKEVRIESIHQLTGFMSTLSLEPEALPLNIKIVLLGDRYIYYLLSDLDPDFQDLFKVAADFDEEIDRSPENISIFSQLIKSLADKHKLLPITNDGVALLIEHSSRMAGDQKKLFNHAGLLADLLQEAHHYCLAKEKSFIDSVDIQTAINEQFYRASRSLELHAEHIKNGVILIDTDESRIGQINALSYISRGNFAFGAPTKITASLARGHGDIIDIEREVKLGGPIHSKGVMILSGYLSQQFGSEQPLSLIARLVFEQSYGGIDGDSASMAEAAVLIATLANVPIKQSLAITGSMNQKGEAQAIAGANEKIEGFYNLCLNRKLTGEQGVIIPKANIEHLMLRKDIVEAAKKKKFHIYAISNIEEALELLTGKTIRSIYLKARNRLKAFAKRPAKK